MCGIFFNICREKSSFTYAYFKELICNRGPDSWNQVEKIIANEWNCFSLGSVLWTQGEQCCNQPVVGQDGSILHWNGDVFHGLPNPNGICDTELIFKELHEHGLLSFTKICGPYAFIYYDASKSLLWFGRDPLGRHSLLCNVNNTELLLASVGCRNIEIDELPTCGIFQIDLSKTTLEIVLHPWSHLGEDYLEGFPYSRGSTLNHPSFTSPLDYNWYNKSPEEYEIEFFTRFSKNTISTSAFEIIASYPPLNSAVQRIKHLIAQSIERRVGKIPNYCGNCISSLSDCNHSKIAILFSGGLDSTILAAVANEIVPINQSIDLYNVAFEMQGSQNNSFLVPDRKNGFESLKDLLNLTPKRKWNFIEINVTQEELKQLRSDHIADLIYPLTSILDDSLGCAVWFAARGEGYLDGQNYKSPARVVLLGMGADEIFGGYSRHRRTFERKGWTLLGLELIEEFRNIGKRNLGRDNRVVADHGRQPRMPYLDEDFVEYATSLPPWQRCNFSHLSIGYGDKLLLRTLAWCMGLSYCCKLPKKAMQFGSKIANSKEKGDQLCKRLLQEMKIK